MPPRPMQQRINLADLKGQIVKKIGLERANRYFYYLSRFFGHKVSKSEFDKLCYLTLGRENLALHNQLIRAVLKNACYGKVPPPVYEKEISKSVKGTGLRSPSKDEGYQQSGPLPSPTSAPLIWGNGELPMSPRKGRSAIRDRRLWNRPSPLGPNGKTDLAMHQSVTADETVQKGIVENGELNSCDLQRPVDHHQGLAEQPENERDTTLLPTKRQGANRLTQDATASAHSKGSTDAIVVEDPETAEHVVDAIISTKRPLQAPLGIPFCSASVGAARRVSTAASCSFASCIGAGELFDSETLRKWMEQIARAEGLDGVSMDCANLLNNGLDAYLKHLIKSCIELVGARSGGESIKHSVQKQQPNGNPINGTWPGHHKQVQSNAKCPDPIQETRSWHPISMLDFKVAMELNPQQLGEDWPQLLEKICLYSYEE